MKIDVLVAEIGSTTTVVNAFQIHQELVAFLGRGIHQTTVDTDVREGLQQAIDDLKRKLKADTLNYLELYASSSAAGGLKMTVHGLVYEMTARAAKEAALNAGGNIHLITANRIEDEHIARIKEISPNMIVIAGGTDFGEKEVSYQNLLSVLSLGIPIIYTGNIANHDRIKKLNAPHVRIVENVYPRVDDFNIMPLRSAIYETFEAHIIHAKGMEHIFKMINHGIIPTPGAVMDTTLLLSEIYEGVLTLDVGGATTDVHSVTDPKPEYQRMLEGEPRMKRSVEGDLGVYVNRINVLSTWKDDEVKRIFNQDRKEVEKMLLSEPYIPKSYEGQQMIDRLCERCVELALDRHVGDLKRVFTTNGYKVIPDGKDLSQVKAIFLTGGALRYAKDPDKMIRRYIRSHQQKLVPDEQTAIYLDKDYIFASLGVLSHIYPEKTKQLIEKTMMKVGGNDVS
ncbi:MAG: glutamate mutase L [Acholeplasmataceae bacterium]|jgi:uncharacterized protein (TIGR01319 family)|nr:glutamate mutase L [Acholeplasmataceae bacterium]